MPTNLFLMTVEIVDDKVLGKYPYAVFAESAEQAHLLAVKLWQDNWIFPRSVGVGLMITIDREIKNGSLEPPVFTGARIVDATTVS
jgi:hypothetical protein